MLFSLRNVQYQTCRVRDSILDLYIWNGRYILAHSLQNTYTFTTWNKIQNIMQETALIIDFTSENQLLNTNMTEINKQEFACKLSLSTCNIKFMSDK